MIENIKNITHALQSLRPGAQWIMRGENYSDIEWVDTVQTKPSIIEVHTEIDRLQAEWETNLYQRQRAAEYPKISDQLDMLWHAINTGNLTTTSSFYTTLAAVKEQFPKP
jgi:4-hydroxyphenylpyruvate dioxygenase-like putative hemolysin